MDKKSGFDIFGKKQILDSENLNNSNRQPYSNRNYSQPVQPYNFERNPSNRFNPNQNSYNPNQNMGRDENPSQNFPNLNEAMKREENPNQNFHNPNQIPRRQATHEGVYDQNQPARREARSNENLTNSEIGKNFHQKKSLLIPQYSQQVIPIQNSDSNENQNVARKNSSNQWNHSNNTRYSENQSQPRHYSNENSKLSNINRGYNKPQGKFNKNFNNRDPIDFYLDKMDNKEIIDISEDQPESNQSESGPEIFKSKKIKFQKPYKDIPASNMRNASQTEQDNENKQANIPNIPNEGYKPKKNFKLKKSTKKLDSMNELEEDENNQSNANQKGNPIIIKHEEPKTEENDDPIKKKSKIVISLDKVNELEKKRKQLVKSLETSERERSLSPFKQIKPKEVKKDEFIKSQVKKSKEQHGDTSLSFERILPTERAKLLSKCSIKEMKDREEQTNINLLEVDPSLSIYDNQLKRYVMKIHPDYAIKAFSRPAADTVMNDPENIRPPQVLSKTIQYILDEIIDLDHDEEKQKKYAKYSLYNDEINFQDIALFVEDRLRAIRQDYTIQNLKGNKNCIEDHERIARFLILCLNQCLDYSPFTGYQGLLKGIIQQLNATMTSLREFYEYVNDQIVNMQEVSHNDCYVSQNQPEFYSYSILLSITETTDLISMLNKIPDSIKHTNQIELTKRIARIIMGKEWISFFKLIRSSECDYLLSCVMSLYFKDMRTAALEQISKSPYNKIKDSNYKVSVNKLCEIFIFEDPEECINFLDWYGMDLNFDAADYPEEKIELIKINSDKGEALLPKKTNRRFLEIKRNNLSRKEVISGYLDDEMLKQSQTAKCIGDSDKKKEVFLPQDRDDRFSKSKEIFPRQELPIKDSIRYNEVKETANNLLFDERDINQTKPDNFFNLKPTIETKSSVKAPIISTTPPDKKQIPISNEKKFEDLNKIEEQFKNDLKSVTRNENVSGLSANTQAQNEALNKKESEIKRPSQTEISKSESEKNKLILNSLKQFENKFKRISHLRFLKFLKKAQTLSHYYDMKIKNFLQIKKFKLFKIIKRYTENLVLNRLYIRELIKMKLDRISVNNYITHDSVGIDKRKFFNYLDLRNMLINKFIEQNSLDKDQKGETINHLKVSIYTEKELLHSTSILQNIFSLNAQELKDNKIEIEEGKTFLNIIERNKYEPNTRNTFSIFINVVFVDQIELGEMPLFIKENLKAIDKFSYGLIFLDYSNSLIVEKLMIILDYANAKCKKEFHLIKYFKMSQLNSFKLDSVIEKINLLKKNYSITQTTYDYFFFPKSDFSIYFSDLVEYYNNREFFTFFENEINIQKFSTLIVGLEEYWIKTKLLSSFKYQDFKKNMFLNSPEGKGISHSKWIKFFIDFETVLNFSSSVKLIIKQILNNFQLNLKEILKVPIELYNLSELERVEKLIKTEEILKHLYKKLRELDLISIFKEMIQNQEFEFEKFMMSPNIYNIINIYLIGLFNSLAAVNNLFSLNIKEFREILLNKLYEIKSNYNLNKGNLFEDLLIFVTIYLKLLNFEIPLEAGFNFIAEEENFESQLHLISSRTFSILENLMSLFRSMGLTNYMEQDFILTKYHLRFLKEIEGTKEEYLMIKSGDTQDIHVKFSYIKNFADDHDRHFDEFLQKKRKSESELERQEKEKEEILLKKLKIDKMKIKQPIKFKSQNNYFSDCFLTFKPQLISLELKKK